MPVKRDPLLARLRRAELEVKVLKAEAELKALKAGLVDGNAGIKISAGARARARQPIVTAAEARKRAKVVQGLFRPAFHPPSVVPPVGDRMEDRLGQDSFLGGNWGGGYGSLMASAYAEGQEFLGYPTLALMAQRGEYRTITRVLASAMTRKWIKIKSGSDDESQQEKINQLDAYMKKLRVRQHFKRAAELDFTFGRGHLFLEFGGMPQGIDPEETKQPVGWGDDEVTRGKVGKDCRLTAIRPVEPVWTYPMSYNTNDPLNPNWYKPEKWFVLGKEVDATRLLRFVMDEVSDLLKPAYSFGGLSKIQVAKPYVDNWLNARQSVADILKGFTTYVLQTNLLATLKNGSEQDLYERIEVFINTRDNNGLMAIDKNQEGFQNVSVPLGGLDRLQSQSLEFICCVSQLPLVYFTGITPSGLNPSSRDEMLVFNETIKSMQEVEFEDNLRVVFHHCQMSIWGEVDEDLDFEFLPLIEMTEIEKTQNQQIKAGIDQQYVEMQVVTPEELREKLAHDPDSPFPGLGLDPDDDQEGELGENAKPKDDDPWKKWVEMGSVLEPGAESRDPFSRLLGLARAPEKKSEDDAFGRLVDAFASDEWSQLTKDALDAGLRAALRHRETGETRVAQPGYGHFSLLEPHVPYEDYDSGFVTPKGKFLSRAQATGYARRNKLLAREPEDPSALHSFEVKNGPDFSTSEGMAKELRGRSQVQDEFHEEDHPRGQPENAGQFASAAASRPSSTTKVRQRGVNRSR